MNYKVGNREHSALKTAFENADEFTLETLEMGMKL